MEAERINQIATTLADLQTHGRAAEVSLTSMPSGAPRRSRPASSKIPTIWNDQKRAQELGKEKKPLEASSAR